MQFKINTPEFEKWKFVYKAINSIIQYRFPQVIVNAWFSILFLPSDCKVSKTSYLIRLYSKLLKVEILALCFRDWNRYFYKVRNSMTSIRLNWEVMFVQDGLSKWHEIAVNSIDINNPWSPSLWFIQNGNHITSGDRHIMSYTKSGQTRVTRSPENITSEKPSYFDGNCYLTDIINWQKSILSKPPRATTSRKWPTTCMYQMH